MRDVRLHFLIVLAIGLAASAAANAQTQPTTAPVSLFRDPVDGAFDISEALSTAAGFLPVAMPITEPAVGYGLGVGLTFFHTHPMAFDTPAGPRMIPPNLTAVFGMATLNDSWAAAVGHLHTWNGGRVRYAVGGGYGSLNLDWFGQSDAFAGRAFSYNIETTFFVQKLTFKLGDSDFFFGPTQRLMMTQTSFDTNEDLPSTGGGLGIFSDELDSNVSGLGLTLGYDTRNSLFSPSRGMKASLSWTQNDEAIGSDFDYGRIDAEVCYYIPVGGPFTLGLRGAVGFAGDSSPYFDLVSISLRGIQYGRYVDNVATTLETELRWDVSQRWTVVGFGGVGWAANQFDELDDSEDRWAGGAGFRYLIARKYDLRMGCDIARGPDDWAFYVTIGTGWLRD